MRFDFTITRREFLLSSLNFECPFPLTIITFRSRCITTLSVNISSNERLLLLSVILSLPVLLRSNERGWIRSCYILQLKRGRRAISISSPTN